LNETVTDSTETQDLLRRLRAGDRGALDQLFAHHEAYLRKVIGIRLGTRIRRRVDESDVVQETQLEATQRMGEYLDQTPMPFRVWLRKLAHDHLSRLREQHIEAQKRTVAREVRLPFRSSVHLARRLLGAGATPSEHTNRRELAQRVRRAIAQLADLDREVMLMMYFEGLSSKQVAFILNLNPVTVRRHHARALLQVHRVLRDNGLTESQL
jgi:RNA polymerase sigma-70 factor (ECF subfamily)